MTSLTRQSPGPGSPGSGNPVGRRISRGRNRSRRQADNLAAGQPVGTPELATVATADAGDAALAAGTAAGTVVDAARTAVAVGITAAAARVLRDEVRDSGARA